MTIETRCHHTHDEKQFPADCHTQIEPIPANGCTCDRGRQLCTEAVALWQTANIVYATHGYTKEYAEALDAYNAHFKETTE